MAEHECFIDFAGDRVEDPAVFDGGYLPVVETGGTYGRQWYVAEDEEHAGAQAREYWSDMVEHDPDEFVAMVGQEALVAWALGRGYAPGSVFVSSLEEWLDLTATVPEEQFASYDGRQIDDITVCEHVAEDIGFVPTVAYRSN